MHRRRLVLLVLVLAITGCGLFHRGGGDADERPRPVPIDLNGASLRKIEALPGITPSMAKRIVDGRPYTDTSELVEKGILTERELDRIQDDVTIPDAR